MRAEYGINLRDAVEGRVMPLDDLAELVVWLPAGSPLWMSVGGPAAVSSDTRAIRLVEFRVRELIWVEGGGKGPRPQPPSDPDYAHERAARQSEMDRKAAAFAARQKARGL